MRKMFPSKQTEQYLGSGKWHCVGCQKSQPFTGFTDTHTASIRIIVLVNHSVEFINTQGTFCQ